MRASDLPAVAVTAEPLTEDGSQEIPTIELSSRAEVHAVGIGLVSNSDENNGGTNTSDSLEDEFPSLAVAEQVPTSVRDYDVEGIGGATSTRLGRYYNDPESRTARAEFVSASFVKASRDTFLGIKLTKDDDGIIEAIASNSIVKQSPLLVGDKLISVNHHRCQNMSNVQIIDTLKHLVGRMTLVAQNIKSETVASDVVESMMTKTNPDDVLGIAFHQIENITDRAVNQRRKLNISYIHRDADTGIVDSLLNVGDEILSINGISVQNMSPGEAKAIIRAAPSTVTIKAITQRETGVVVAELSSRYVPSDLIAATSPPTTNTHPTVNGTDIARENYLANEMDEQQRIQFSRGCMCIMISVVALGVLYFATRGVSL